MSTVCCNSLNYNFLNLNSIKVNNSSHSYISTTFKVIYPFFFYYRFITNKIHNDSLFFFFSYFPTKYKNSRSFVYHKSYNFVFLNRSFSYWLNNHLVLNRYNPYIMKNNFLFDSYNKYIYVFKWF